jgi:hypothetical protein
VGKIGALHGGSVLQGGKTGRHKNAESMSRLRVGSICC